MTITTDGGTTFSTMGDGRVMITRSDQPVCIVPLADLIEFLGLRDIEDDDDGADLE
jgi:hypothetical protein